MSANDNNHRVRRLDAGDPLNHALVAWQAFFADVHEKRSAQYDRDLAAADKQLRYALREGFVGFLDAKIKDDGKIYYQRRKFGSKPPAGRWYSLPVAKEVIDELFERIQEAPEPATTVVDVDASAPQQALPGAPAPTPAEMLRARAREATALMGNIERTMDEVASATGVRLSSGVETAAEELRARLERAADLFEAREDL